MDERDDKTLRTTWHGRIRWILIVMLTPVSLFFCGQIAWSLYRPVEAKQLRSDLTADYSPWQSTFFPGLDPNILAAALRDQEDEGWVDTRQVLDCFLLTGWCQTATPKLEEVQEEERRFTPTPLRIANYVEPDFDRPDGVGLEIRPGQDILLDIRTSPIIFPSVHDAGAEVLIFTVDSMQQGPALIVSLALKPEGPWTTIYSWGDQTPGDNLSEIPYSNGNGEDDENFDPSTSSEDVWGTQYLGLAIDVDPYIRTPGLYGWMRLQVGEGVHEPVSVDAILVIESDG